MSVFRGSVAEYPGVIIDHFVPTNCERGQAFFLSHCHKGEWISSSGGCLDIQIGQLVPVEA